jgi:hypothetical protein
LQTLNLERNQLPALPELLGQLTQLQTLNLSYNQLTALSESLGQLTQLQTLMLYSNQLTALPESLGQLTQLQTLDLSSNHVTALPEWLGQLTQLHTLSLGYNRFATTPACLSELKELTNLDLRDNPIGQVPSALQFLSKLEALCLHDCRLDSIPDWIGNLRSLRFLGIGGNQLADLPDSIGELQQLTTLFLGYTAGDGNPLVRLPDCVRRLKNLEMLMLAKCRLTDLPNWILEFTKLKQIELASNPVNSELAAAYKQGLDAVKAYLRAKADGQIVLNEAKLILIGEGEVGKFCLLDALQDEPFQKHSSTHGIEIKPVRVTHSGDDGSETEISLNTWDFGGQKVDRPTHQMFFTAPAVYLVVWKPREGPQQGAVEFWIETILSRAGNGARILVIATHGGPGQRLPDLAQQELRDRFGESVVGFLSVDSQPEGYDEVDESTSNGN